MYIYIYIIENYKDENIGTTVTAINNNESNKHKAKPKQPSTKEATLYESHLYKVQKQEKKPTRL